MKPGKAFPYLAFLTEPGEPWDTLKNSSYLRSGPYAEYYPNGRVKVEGQYKIVKGNRQPHNIRLAYIRTDKDACKGLVLDAKK